MKKLLAAVLALTMVLASALVLVPVSAEGETGFVDAMTANPDTYYDATEFYIYNFDDFKAFADDTYVDGHDYLGKTIKLMNDIKMNDTTREKWWEEDLAQGYKPNTMTQINGYAMVGGQFKEVGFRGTLDGQGYTVKGFVAETQENYGGSLVKILNGATLNSARILNLNFDGFWASNGGTSCNLGVFAGRVWNGGVVMNCSVKNATLELVEINNTSHSLGMLFGTAYNKVSDAASFGVTRSSFPLQIINVTVDNTCEIKQINAGDVTTPSGGIVGCYWAEGSCPFEMEFSGCNINFNGIEQFDPMGPYDGNGTWKVASDFILTIKGDTVSLGENHEALITALEADGTGWKMDNNEPYTPDVHTPGESCTDFDIEERVEPKCNRYGTEEKKTCKVCGHVVGGEQIEKSAHTYVNGRCTVCLAKDPDATTEATTTETPVVPETPVDGTTTGGDNGNETPTGTTTGTGTTAAPTDGTTAEGEAPATDDCASCGGAGAIAAAALSVISIFGMALIVKKH